MNKKMHPDVKKYIAKTVSFVGSSDPLALLQSAPIKIERAVRGLTNSQLKKRPMPGKWSIHEILGHLADTEAVFAWRLRRAMAEPGSNVEGYDQNMWARTFNYSKAQFNDLLSAYKFNRAWNIRLLHSLPARVRANGWVNHSERGKEKGKHLLAMIAGHDLNHLSQIEAIKTRFRWNEATKGHSGAAASKSKRAAKPARSRRTSL